MFSSKRNLLGFFALCCYFWRGFVGACLLNHWGTPWIPHWRPKVAGLLSMRFQMAWLLCLCCVLASQSRYWATINWRTLGLMGLRDLSLWKLNQGMKSSTTLIMDSVQKWRPIYDSFIFVLVYLSLIFIAKILFNLKISIKKNNKRLITYWGPCIWSIKRKFSLHAT